MLNYFNKVLQYGLYRVWFIDYTIVMLSNHVLEASRVQTLSFPSLHLLMLNILYVLYFVGIINVNVNASNTMGLVFV